MSRESEESETVEVAPEPRPKLGVPVILAIMLGVVLTLLAGGAILYYQKLHAFEAELALAKAANKKNTILINDLIAQLEDFSRQMDSLKEYSIARSTPLKKDKGDAVQPATKSDASPTTQPEPPKSDTPVDPALPEGSTKAGKVVGTKPAGTDEAKAPPAPQPKPKPEPRENCSLAGKTPQEQAATLQRCVSAMDTKPEETKKDEKPKSGRN